MLNFKWRHFKKAIILMLVRWYLAYPLSYREIEELALERGLEIDHSTIWALKLFIQQKLLYQGLNYTIC